MIHLFKRVYLCFAESNNTNGLSLIFSQIPRAAGKSKGWDMANILDYQVNYQSCIGEGTKFQSNTDFFNWLIERNDPIYIYADTYSFAPLFISWFKLILKESTPKSLFDLYRSYIFKLELLHKSSIDLNDDFNFNSYKYNLEQWNNIYSTVKVNKNKNFIEKFSHTFGVEFLLASYLANGSYKEQLKSSIIPLLRKDLEKYLFELKEIILVHLLHKPFIKQFKLSQNYDFENFQEILNESSPTIHVFFDERIWRYQEMRSHSSHANIFFENITQEDIKQMAIFSKYAGCMWSEESCYQFTKSDVNKLEFIPYLVNFTDEGLKRIIEVESAFINAAGSFFSIDLTTVNHYLVHTILEKWNEKDSVFNMKYLIG